MSTVKRFKPLGEMVERSTVGGGSYVLASEYDALLARLGESQKAYQQLLEHTNETEQHLDEAANLLGEIIQSGQAYTECTDKGSATGQRVAAVLSNTPQFQPEPHPVDPE